MKRYKTIDRIELDLEERLLTYIAQDIACYQSCTYLNKLIELTGVDKYTVAHALDRLERKHYIYWERAASLHNIHLVNRKQYQQHPVKLVRDYRKRRIT